jgi:sulfopyruvate decarboxylase subunit alpha
MSESSRAEGIASSEPHRPGELLSTLKALGFQVAVCVPDSWLGGIAERIGADSGMTLVRATHEEEGLAIACGARLGGKRSVLLVQNVGLLTMGSGLVALAMRYQFPVLILAPFRGSPQDPIYYHVGKGRVTEPVLRAYGLPYAVASPSEPIALQVENAAAWAEEAFSPFVLLLAKEDIKW